MGVRDWRARGVSLAEAVKRIARNQYPSDAPETR